MGINREIKGEPELSGIGINWGDGWATIYAGEAEITFYDHGTTEIKYSDNANNFETDGLIATVFGKFKEFLNNRE